MLYRNTTRVLKNTTEITKAVMTVASETAALVLTASDYLYLGFKQPFTTRYFYFSTVNSNAASLSVEYYDGSDWSSVEDLIDQTDGFTQSGFVSWRNPGDWQTKEQDPVISSTVAIDLKLYWLRISVSADLSAGTAIQSILNLFCDETLLRTYYPEIASDSRYLPPDRTDFLEQMNAAKDMIVRRLKQAQKINDESQVIDITQVEEAAVHATAYLILFPIAEDESTRQMRDDAYKAMGAELDRYLIEVDEDDSGDIELDEEVRDTSNYMTR